MSKILVLNVKKYDFENDKKKNIKGGKIAYLASNVKPNQNMIGPDCRQTAPHRLDSYLLMRGGLSAV